MAKRPIFQEVSAPASSAPVPAGNLIESGPRGARGAIRAWLIVLFVMVAAMIAFCSGVKDTSRWPMAPSSVMSVSCTPRC